MLRRMKDWGDGLNETNESNPQETKYYIRLIAGPKINLLVGKTLSLILLKVSISLFKTLNDLALL